ncbi:prepilin-type N-terminal cleavage/methylation domain-containing protein, partial [Clostridium perfringens]
MKGNLLSRIGWINNKKKKRGFTLLEITITISIQII